MSTTSHTRTGAEQLAGFVSSLDLASIPADVVAAAKEHILDVVGCALAARGVGAAEYVRQVALDSGGSGASSVIGEPGGRSPAAAALANGGLAHALDFDDTHTPSICHVSAVVVPAALAVAEAERCSGRDVLTAIIAGNEVVARVGTLAASAYMKTGFHHTSVCGIFGATVATARLRELDEGSITNALGIAGSMASGLFEYLSDGSTTKAVNAGWAAHGGVMATLLAKAGGDGPKTIIEGRFGVLATHFRLDTRDAAVDWALSERWETPAISFKPYPACHFVHSSLDAARGMLDDGLDARDIEDVLVAIPEPAVPLVLEPHEDKIRPRTPFDAKFSLPYSLATMLLRGEVGIESYMLSAIQDADVLELATRVRYEVEAFDAYPAVLPARVSIATSDGGLLTRVAPDGLVEQPVARSEVIAKFRANAELALPGSAVDQLEASLLDLEQISDLSDALAPVRQALER